MRGVVQTHIIKKRKGKKILQSTKMFFRHLFAVKCRACSAVRHPRTAQNDTKYGLILWRMINTGSLWVE